jgi:hypothetical protein
MTKTMYLDVLFFSVLTLYTPGASCDICTDDGMSVDCRVDGIGTPSPQLHAIVTDLQLTKAMARVFSMSDGSQMATSPSERAADCVLDPSGTLCTTRVNSGLSSESVRYVANLFKWLKVQVVTGNHTHIVIDLSEENLLDILMMSLVGKLVNGDAEDIFGSDGLDAFPRIAIEQHTGRLIVVESTWKFRTRILETLLIITIITLVKILSDSNNTQ